MPSRKAVGQADEPIDGEVVTPPVPILSGTFSLFERPNGSMVLAYLLADGTEGRKVIPAMMVKQAIKFQQRAAARMAEAED